MLKHCLIFLFLFISNLINAQDISMGGSKGGKAGGNDSLDKNFTFLPLPYINYNRSTGFSIGAIPMAMYKLNREDTISPASISGLVGVYTTNKTWFAMFFQQLYFKEDTWRITSAGGLGSYNFQFFIDYPYNTYIDYSTDMVFFYLNVNRKLFAELYGGIHYTYMKFDTRIADLPTSKETEQHGTGIILSYDERSDVYYPRKGFISNANWSTYPAFMGNPDPSNKIDIDHNHFFSSRKDKDVIALRAKIGVGLGNLAFEQQFIIGRNDIRGYTEGKYRGNQMLAIQGEYRWNFYKKMSAVGFFGLASIFSSNNSSQNGEILPGIGCGLRYTVAEEYHMNVGFDIAVGKDDWGFYFRVGEAF